MTRFFTFFLFLSVIGRRADGQPAELRGTIDADSGMIYLNYAGDDAYYRRGGGSLEAAVHKGRFVFRDSLAYPCAFQLLYTVDSSWKYISGFFLFEPGGQSIRCHVDSMWKVPDVDNAGTREWKAWAAGMPAKDAGAYRLAYVRAHPDSYVALWDLIGQLAGGYKPVLDSLYDGLSVALKRSYPGMVLGERLRSLAQTAQGRTFPAAVLADEGEHEVRFSGAAVHARYTLVDFWFSHCDPCISRFRELRAVYAEHRGQDLEIVAISTDGQKDLGEWRAVIQREGFDWKQYLDKGGVFAHQLSITGYPTNFLLDEHGVIIRRDILPEELKKLLDSP